MNREIFEDTMIFLKENLKLVGATEESIRKQKMYLAEKDMTAKTIEGRFNEMAVFVSRKRCLEAAEPYVKSSKKVCVLNFASATNPGGGVVRGSSAQKEALCRCSTLYSCINTDELLHEFYRKHRNAKNPLYNDDCIYTPKVNKAE